MKVVAIGGSPRLNGNTNYLLDVTLKELNSRGVETEKIILSQYKINPCQGHDNCASFPACPQQDDASWILEKFRLADGIVLASPVYYCNVSAQIKAFIDRNNFLFKHHQKIKARCAGLIVVAGFEGTEEALAALKRAFLFSNPDTRVFTLSGHEDKPGLIKTQAEIVKQAADMGRLIAEHLSAGA
jgi:multimeric flavodoxin WrbA